MNRNPIQSQLPEFGTSSMTSERLYQHPEPQQESRIAEAAKNTAAFLLIASIFAGLAIMFIHQADREAANQIETIAQAVGERE
ncbi:MAG TPA: hypothetical protein DIC32_10240 [Acinetobacter radioresistens]|uniref:Uncharacterized protein n=1 Tax=Acinetobacter radioresistens TaxID=40216 RepID=A0A3D3G2A2_ACIRA|nr:hypothetical protein [Acinetobacter radioresistens]